MEGFPKTRVCEDPVFPTEEKEKEVIETLQTLLQEKLPQYVDSSEADLENNSERGKIEFSLRLSQDDSLYYTFGQEVMTHEKAIALLHDLRSSYPEGSDIRAMREGSCTENTDEGSIGCTGGVNIEYAADGRLTDIEYN